MTDPQSYPSRISKKEIAELPMAEPEVAIHLVRADADIAPAIAALRDQPVVGFDTETRPAFRKGQSYLPSTVQLATEDQAWVFQLCHLRDPGPLRELLADVAVGKTGVAVGRDTRELVDLFGTPARGFIDLEPMARERGFINTGLRPLLAIFEGVRLSKAAQTSNWAARELTAKQIRYAGLDAWASLRVWCHLDAIPLPPNEDEENPDGT